MTLFTTILAGLLTAFFLFASSIKILGWQKFIFETQLSFFKRYGLNRQIMWFVGLTEMTSVALLWWPQAEVRWFGALTLALVSLGALFFHLRFDTLKDGAAATITLCLSLILVFYR